MKRIVIFCGSSPGVHPSFMTNAFSVGEYLAECNIELIYGGASVGLMGAVADGALSKGGRVVGVLPSFLSKKEIAHDGLSELIIVNSMHARKNKMVELSDGAIALPGGFGTLEELFEYLTWAQLGLHKNRIGVLNINGFYDSLLNQLQQMVEQGFLKELNKQMLLSGDNIEDLITHMNSYSPPSIDKWITPDTN